MGNLKQATAGPELELLANDYFTLIDEYDKHIGRYPKAYRKYENYENYRIFNPNATLQDYHDESMIYK